MKVKFNRQVGQLGYFLAQVWNFMALHGLIFLDNKTKVNFITMALDGEAANWVFSFMMLMPNTCMILTTS